MFIIEFIFEVIVRFINENNVKNNRSNKMFIIILSVFTLGLLIIGLLSLLNK